MIPPEPTAELTRLAHGVAALVTQMHPLAGQVSDPAAKAELFKALFEITKQVEVVKKQALKLQKRDDSALL